MKLENPTTHSVSADALALEHFWMPFTANRQFKQAPRLLSGAKDMHYTTPDGRRILDGTAGLWCVNAGHCRAPIVEAVQKQAATMDFAPTFQMGHPKVFEAATAVAGVTPKGMERVFFTNSGSESVDTAMKIAMAYHRARGEASRRIIIGRERGYHGVNMGGTAVGGIPGNRKVFPALMPLVDHLRSTHDMTRNAWSRGVPAHGVEFADELERVVMLHDPSNIAALIEIVTATLKKGDNVALVGFGTFEVRKRAARTGRNPATGVEGFDRQFKSLGHRDRAECNDRMVSVRAPARLHDIPLRRRRGLPGGRSQALHVHDYAGDFRHGCVTDIFLHQ